MSSPGTSARSAALKMSKKPTDPFWNQSPRRYPDRGSLHPARRKAAPFTYIVIERISDRSQRRTNRVVALLTSVDGAENH